MEENLEKRAKQAKPYYKLRGKDLIPIYGVQNYISRTEKEESVDNINKAASITARLILYNCGCGLFFGGVGYFAIKAIFQ